MTGVNAITWDTARAAGFVSYALLTTSVSLGLVLRNRWQSTRWPRLVTNELHGFVSLLALVFIAIHVLAVTVDPFTHFGLAAVLVPFATSYRTIWMSLGIVSLYLVLAVWLSSMLRRRIGHRLWRQIHILAFAVYGAATLHGLGTGSDTRTTWGAAIYLGSVGVVGTLLAIRLVAPAGQGSRPRPLVAVAAAAGVVLAALWAVNGPLARGWSARAGGSHSVRSAVSAPARRLSRVRIAAPATQAVVHPPFSARFSGRLTVQPVDAAGRLTVRIDGALAGGTRDHLEILIHGVPLDDGGVAMEQSRVRMGTTTALYQGSVVALRGTRLVVALRSPRQRVRLAVSLRIDRDGRVEGAVHGTAASSRAGSV